MNIPGYAYVEEEADRLSINLVSWAQNEEMIDAYYTEHGLACLEAVNLIEALLHELRGTK